MLLVDDLAAGGTKNLRHTPRGLVTLRRLHRLVWVYTFQNATFLKSQEMPILYCNSGQTVGSPIHYRKDNYKITNQQARKKTMSQQEYPAFF